MKNLIIALFLLLNLSLVASQYWVVGEIFSQSW